MSDDRQIPNSPALWWVETPDGVRSILRVVVDHNGSDTYLGFLAFEKLPRGDGSSWPVERFTGRWLAPVMLHEEVERLEEENGLLQIDNGGLRGLVEDYARFARDVQTRWKCARDEPKHDYETALVDLYLSAQIREREANEALEGGQDG